MCWKVCCSGYASLSLWAATLHVKLGHIIDSSVPHSICYQLKRLPCGEEIYWWWYLKWAKRLASEMSNVIENVIVIFHVYSLGQSILATSRLFDQVLSNI